MKQLTSRRLHLWLALLILVPLLVMSVSGIVIALRGAMPPISVPLSWMGAEKLPSSLPMTAFVETTDGKVWIGTAQGVSSVADGKVLSLDAFKGQEIVALAQLNNHPSPIVATKMAVWVLQDGAWVAMQRGRVRMLSRLTNGSVLAIVGGRGEFADGKPLITDDGVHWKPYQTAIQANSQMPPLTDPSVALHMFMRELHSGAYFFGKGLGEWLYSGAIGILLMVLLITGMMMAIKILAKKKHRKAQTAELHAAN